MENSLEAIDYQTGKRLQLDYENGVFTKRTVKESTSGDAVPYVAPGFIDLQINGYRGVDFNTVPINASAIVEMSAGLWKEGVTSYFPTIVTNRPERIEEAMDTIVQVCHQHPEVNASISGIHLEGPFISPEDGPRGAHNVNYVRSPDWPLVCKWQKAANGKIKIITLSPEWKDAPTFIQTCTQHGIRVAIGHTAANPEQIRAAVEAGATLSTHLGNGAHVFLRRHPNYIWEQLANDQLAATFIGDGFHLPPAVLKTIIRMKGKRAILVSDSVSLAGMAAGAYRLHIGGDVVLTEQGKLHMANHPDLLAGSVQSQLGGLNYLLKNNVCNLADAVDLATANPANWLGYSDRKLEVGHQADFILFTYRKDAGLELCRTIKNGQSVFTKQSGVKK